jgi:hypothetical protein
MPEARNRSRQRKLVAGQRLRTGRGVYVPVRLAARRRGYSRPRWSVGPPALRAGPSIRRVTSHACAQHPCSAGKCAVRCGARLDWPGPVRGAVGAAGAAPRMATSQSIERDVHGSSCSSTPTGTDGDSSRGRSNAKALRGAVPDTRALMVVAFPTEVTRGRRRIRLRYGSGDRDSVTFRRNRRRWSAKRRRPPSGPTSA